MKHRRTYFGSESLMLVLQMICKADRFIVVSTCCSQRHRSLIQKFRMWKSRCQTDGTMAMADVSTPEVALVALPATCKILTVPRTFKVATKPHKASTFGVFECTGSLGWLPTLHFTAMAGYACLLSPPWVLIGLAFLTLLSGVFAGLQIGRTSLNLRFQIDKLHGL